MRTALYLVLFMLFCVAPAAAAGVAGLSPEEAHRSGERMYRAGILPSGSPMKAVAQGDLELQGTMVTCANCHMRSGLGSFEGNVLTPPTNGAKLFAPLRSSRDLPGSGMARGQLAGPRPAYTDEALARVLRTGIDPTGRKLSETMPRYAIGDHDMEILISYLKGLSSAYPPGVTGGGVRFATVVAGEVDPKERDAMLEPLKTYIRDEWNARLPVIKQLQRDSSYLPATLDVWELKGPAESWKGQLESLYRQQPVFALLGGISSGAWDPVHEFCEKNMIPCVLPLTELPVVSEDDWYTLYYSRGYHQEGEAAAKYLARVLDLPEDKQIVQVFRDNGEGKALSKGFADVWKKLGRASLKNRIISAGDKTGGDFLKDISIADPDAVLLLWLGPEDLAGAGALASMKEKPSLIFVSATMLEGDLALLPDSIRDLTLITYPNRLPDEGAQIRSTVNTWLQIRNIRSTDANISPKMYFLTRMVSNAMSDMRGNFYRDYFLDLFDVNLDQTNTAAAYPRLSFGPGQRYASKGCYIVKLSEGAEPRIIRLSEWIIY